MIILTKLEYNHSQVLTSLLLCLLSVLLLVQNVIPDRGQDRGVCVRHQLLGGVHPVGFDCPPPGFKWVKWVKWFDWSKSINGSSSQFGQGLTRCMGSNGQGFLKVRGYKGPNSSKVQTAVGFRQFNGLIGCIAQMVQGQQGFKWAKGLISLRVQKVQGFLMVQVVKWFTFLKIVRGFK